MTAADEQACYVVGMARTKGPPAPRDEKGLWRPGTSPNPGGLTKAQREARAAFTQDVPEMIATLRSMLRGDDPEDRRFALEKMLNRALGKEGKASELPLLEAPAAPDGAADTQALLEKTRRLMAVHLATLQAQQDAGDASPETFEKLGNVVRSLGDMLVAEEKARQASKLSGLSTEELVDVVGKLLPREALERMLAARLADEVKP